MKEDIKRQWVAALRSGEYSQGRGDLHNVNTQQHCCLGVLCDLAVKSGLPVVVREAFDGSGHTTYDGLGDLVPPSIQEWAGLPDSNPTIEVGPDPDGWDDEDELAQLNDDRGYSFARIADLIEAQL